MSDERDPRTFAIIGAAMEVHRQLGCGFLEAVYQEAMELELAARGIPFSRQVELLLFYKGQPLKCRYRADFVCFESVVVELKAQAQLTGTDDAKALNYLKATGFKPGYFSTSAAHLCNTSASYIEETANSQLDVSQAVSNL